MRVVLRMSGVRVVGAVVDGRSRVRGYCAELLFDDAEDVREGERRSLSLTVVRADLSLGDCERLVVLPERREGWASRSWGGGRLFALDLARLFGLRRLDFELSQVGLLDFSTCNNQP